ncbi:hypothetical protein NECAME_01861 [Necator americanus]|uniref:Core-2/I-Branching enzyme n=1 Tax=Necator americanus TaxID=51031 RepID=W2TPX0_NECAM|nr:hypothetical protein NECAME_01861 [Necator americanus]ETN83062.1 hypothetical protein NECAME_01861 [Necator americanus]
MEQIAQHRPVFVSRKMGYSCEEVQDRILPKYPMEKIEHGVAHARVVYKDYEFIEEELRSNYHWQNHFCYTLDSKSSPNFRIKIRQLPVCLRNVYVVSEEFNIDSWGKSMNKAHFECLKFLIKKQGWNYVLLLQNYDVIIKSVYEIVEIYRLLSGANDVEIVRAPLDLRIRHRRRWDAKSLNLFPEASKSKENATLRFAKGVVQASLSRAAVDWMVNRVNLTTLIENINQEPFSDELLIQSLQITDEFDMPGRFSYECSQTGSAGTITRLTHWIMGSPNDCLSRHVRHDICIMGVEHIPELSRTPHILVNKVSSFFCAFFNGKLENMQLFGDLD